MALNAAAGVSEAAASCHTAFVDDYVIVGHVPVGAITHLLETRPAGRGLTLPGMPSDSPGMGGNPDTWESQPVMLIQNDGEMTRFDY